MVLVFQGIESTHLLMHFSLSLLVILPSLTCPRVKRKKKLTAMTHQLSRDPCICRIPTHKSVLSVYLQSNRALLFCQRGVE
ncbi:hypothetical protein F5X96DRAFT_650455 [Biscogniauxia mediterranea]|nr:hypothetical protein F5X96DRAFT_650455 [Biscogniauxia mediterranea]